MFGVKEVALSDIPEAGVFGSEETPRSRWAGEVLEAFIESPAGVWEITCDEEGRTFTSSKHAQKACTSLYAKAKQRKYIVGNTTIQAVQRGQRVFISKLKITKGE